MIPLWLLHTITSAMSIFTCPSRCRSNIAFGSISMKQKTALKRTRLSMAILRNSCQSTTKKLTWSSWHMYLCYSHTSFLPLFTLISFGQSHFSQFSHFLRSASCSLDGMNRIIFTFWNWWTNGSYVTQTVFGKLTHFSGITSPEEIRIRSHEIYGQLGCVRRVFTAFYGRLLCNICYITFT